MLKASRKAWLWEHTLLLLQLIKERNVLGQIDAQQQSQQSRFDYIHGNHYACICSGLCFILLFAYQYHYNDVGVTLMYFYLH